MNKMTVIQLLNKIANGEEPPKKIRLGRYLIMEYDGKEYIEQTNKKPFLYYIWNLNEKVEIIEDEPKDIEVCGSLFTRSEYNRLAGIKEDKKIEKLEYYDNSIMWCMNGREITDNEKDIIDKINEIIDKINGGTDGE